MTTCLHTLFEQQAELHPSLTAVKFQNKKISYKELNEQSNRLANYLRSHGVETGDKVSIYIKRSIEMLVAILGILKSGAAYVPIEPKLPAERLKFLLDDVDSEILVTKKEIWGQITCPQKVIRLDVDQEIISKYSDVSPDIEIDDNNTAVILYTSGSTGYPKGVLLSHKSLVNRLIWDREAYKHTAKDIVLQQASYTFDFSILEIFMALSNGGKLILARPEFHYESFYLIDLIRQEKITKMGSGPSLLKAYIHLPSFEKCFSLKQVFLGGETLHCDLQNTFFEKSSSELINIYGPTETSISVLHWACKRNSKDKVVPIGFPVANMKIYLLDEKREPVSDGDPGEIYISGIGVGTGYHNRHELTAKHFLKDPFASDKETRMYKTGDLGKKLPDGSIQFLGRKDYQVKVRGLRIELEEIEYHITAHESIKACVVSGVENQKKEMKLVAYVIAEPGIDLNIDEIKNYLLLKLPEYLVPSLYIQMREFPLSPNGKIDRMALPYPDNVRLLSGGLYTPAYNKTQVHLVSIWEKVLELKSIGITDPFYSIGGDSLASIEIHTLMESEMGCTLPLRSFINANTIQEQAKIIDDAKIVHSSKLVQLRSSGKKTPIIFVGPAQSTGISMPKILMKYLDRDCPVLAILPFGDDIKNIPDSIEEIARHYVQLLESQYPSLEYTIGGSSMGGLIAFEMASILKEKGTPVQLLFLVDTFHPATLGNNDYQIRKRIFFYLKKLSNSNTKIRREILEHLKSSGLNLLNGLFKKGEQHPVLQNLKDVSKISPKKKKILIENKNHALALSFNPRHYYGNVLLISVKVDDKSHIYQDQTIQDEREKSIRNWKDNIKGELYTYEIPGTHKSIMKEPNIKIVANIINDQVLNN